MTATLGIDIGGTSIKLGLVAVNGEMLARTSRAYDRALSFTALVDALAEAGHLLQSECGIRAHAVGIAMPGHVDAASGILVDGANNVPSLMRQKVRQEFAERFRLPTIVANDGTAATIGEMRFGAGSGFRRFALVVFGTGVGGGIAIDGSVITGARGEPPELGAIVLDPAATAPDAKPQGTLEHLASASGFLRAYARFGGADAGVAVEELFERASGHEPAALRAIDWTARWIAQGFGMLINTLNLEACIIGGGLAAAGDLLAAPIRRQLADFAWPLLLANARVLVATTGNDAGVLGAAALAAAQGLKE